MSFFRSLIIAFSMYSKIPMPRVEWNKENQKYSLICFPLIGVVIGGFILGWWEISRNLAVGPLFRSAIFSILPILITGGIHLDGFLDTLDAKSSYGSQERKLEILMDPHIGAFALIGGLSYFIMVLGAFSEIGSFLDCLLISLGYILSRCFSGLSLVYFPAAKKEGLLYTFSTSAQKYWTRICLWIVTFIVTMIMVILEPLTGVIWLVLSFIIFLYYKRMSLRDFGGITGDLAGFFLIVYELALLLLIAMI